jgi:hypothetical protein
MRQTITGIKAELFHNVNPDVNTALAEFNSIPNFAKCSADVKKCTSRVMECVQETLHTSDINGGVWKLSAKKCVNTLTGISVLFLSGKVQVNIPRNRIQPSIMVYILNVYGKKVSISGDSGVFIDLDATTIDAALQIIKTGECDIKVPNDTIKIQ